MREDIPGLSDWIDPANDAANFKKLFEVTPMQIEHQYQPTTQTCMATCFAMLLGRSAEYVAKEVDHQLRNYTLDPIYYMISQNCKMIRVENRARLQPGCVYLLAVPALVSPGAMHEIILDTRGANGPVVLDPSRNRRYSLNPTADNEVLLTSWVIDYLIVDSKHLGIHIPESEWQQPDDIQKP